MEGEALGWEGWLFFFWSLHLAEGEADAGSFDGGHFGEAVHPVALDGSFHEEEASVF